MSDLTFDFPAQACTTAGSHRVEFSLHLPMTLMRPQAHFFVLPIAFYGSSLDLRAVSSLAEDCHCQDGAGLIISGYPEVLSICHLAHFDTFRSLPPGRTEIISPSSLMREKYYCSRDDRVSFSLPSKFEIYLYESIASTVDPSAILYSTSNYSAPHRLTDF